MIARPKFAMQMANEFVYDLPAVRRDATRQVEVSEGIRTLQNNAVHKSSLTPFRRPNVGTGNVSKPVHDKNLIKSVFGFPGRVLETVGTVRTGKRH